MKFNFSIAMLGLTIAATTTPAHAACVRHFYNHSNVPWEIATGGGVACDGQEKCTVPAGGTADISYQNVGRPIWDKPWIELRASVMQYNRFTTSSTPFVECPALDHNGKTGNIYLNDPSDGDLSTCEGDCH